MVAAVFLSVPGICGKGPTYFEWIHNTYEFTVYDIWFAFPPIEVGCISFVSSVCSICRLGTNDIRYYMWLQLLVEFIIYIGGTIEFNYYMNSINLCFILMNSYIIWTCLNASTNHSVHTVCSGILVMPDLNYYSDEDRFDYLCTNEEQINSGDVDFDISADEDNPKNSLPQSDPPIFKSLSKESTGYGWKTKILVFEVFFQRWW